MGMTDVAQYFTAKKGDAVTAGSTASSNIIDLGRTKPQIGVGQLPLTLEIRTVKAAGGSGTVQFALRKSATQSGGALNGTVTQILLTPAMTKGSDSRIDIAGNYVLRVPLPYEADQQYLDIYAILTGTATITYEARIAEAPSAKHTQVMASNVGNP